MPEASQSDVLTNYLMFKVSLISWDHELGCESLRRLSECAERGQSQDILYACIREAQQFGDKICTLAALKTVADTWEPGQASTSNFPCILRCAIRLIHLIQEQDEGGCNSEQANAFVEDICKIFEKGTCEIVLDLDKRD